MEVNTTVHDVAAYVLQKRKPITAMKLQKLVYYCQAWSLVWDEKPIFNERIEAWPNGSISPNLWEVHEGQFEISSLPKGSPDNLDDNQKESVNAVFEYYSGHTSQWLSDLTHMEASWINARKGAHYLDHSNNEITLVNGI